MSGCGVGSAMLMTFTVPVGENALLHAKRNVQLIVSKTSWLNFSHSVWPPEKRLSIVMIWALGIFSYGHVESKKVL